MRTFLIYLTFCCCTFLNAESGTFEQSFSAGNEAFAREDFAAAIEYYNEASTYGLSANLLNNLGSAYHRQGERGRAIWAWRKALNLDSTHAEAAHHLDAVLQEKGLPPYSSGWFERFYHFFTVNQWGIAATILFWVMVAGVILPHQRNRRNPAILFLVICSAVLFLVCVVSLGGYHLERNDAVVLNSGLELKVAPHGDSPAASSTREGEILQVLRERDGFFLLESKDGRSGWLEAANVGKIWSDD